MRTSLITAALLAFSVPTNAATTLESIDNGWYSNSGSHVVRNNNIITGRSSGTQYRSFFVFDLSDAISVDALSITFFGSNGSFVSNAGTETIGLFDYTGSVTGLIGGTGGLAAFSDLGSGALLGQHTINASNFSAMPEFTVNLSPTFVSQFNSAIGSSDQRIALGGALQTLGDGPSEAFWSASGIRPVTARLNVETVNTAVPEPGTWAMMLLGFGFVGGAMRSARRRQKLSVSYA